MANITIKIPDNLKKDTLSKTSADGITLTFLVNQACKAYVSGDIKFWLITPQEEDEITASFDISNQKGKEECLNYFKSL